MYLDENKDKDLLRNSVFHFFLDQSPVKQGEQKGRSRKGETTPLSGSREPETVSKDFNERPLLRTSNPTP